MGKVVFRSNQRVSALFATRSPTDEAIPKGKEFILECAGGTGGEGGAGGGGRGREIWIIR